MVAKETAEDAPRGASSEAIEPEAAPESRGKRARRRAARGEIAADIRATPIFVQYLAIKEAHPGYLLFYRMGDFYELFFDDAKAAAAALDITLTRRGRHEGDNVPMCGVPVHSAHGYLERLIREGFRVAICEQTEDPAEARKRGAKALVNREVVRLVTSGTLTEDALLDARRPNFLAALAKAEGRLALAWLEISTGSFSVAPVTADSLAAELAGIDPGELLVSEALLQEAALFEVFGEWKRTLTPQAPSLFDSRAGERKLKTAFRVAALDAFGPFGRAELGACGALVAYVELTQKGRLPRLAPPRLVAAGSGMVIDAATRRNLELGSSLSGAKRGSLLAVIDRTVTSAGARLLLGHLAAPLTDPDTINDRLERVRLFVDDARLREALREILRRCADIERALSRLTVGRGGPRDFAAIRDALAQVPLVREALASAQAAGEALTGVPAGIAVLVRDLGHHAELVGRLERALIPAPPILARDGGFIAPGYAAKLDELKTLRDESKRLIANLEARYRDETGIASLKIRHNKVLGYYVEVTPAQAEKVGEGFIHRQTLASAVRYATVELGELEDKMSRAADRALALELELFDELLGEVAARADEVARAAAALAGFDVASALAVLAVERDYCRPKVDSSLAFEIRRGRHAMVEAAAPETGGQAPAAFVANDCELGAEQRLWLITGPNMAGKSTFLRQNALIAVLAQMGSFVPAESAHIGVVDRLFSRVGAADDLARGRSTFMVEMIETATILNQATERSLVILDEIGRGTATFDGLSIAWATVEHLHEINRCRALFATHYHELTPLAVKYASLACHTMRVKEWQGEVVFLHEVVPGVADRSYGIHVARLAGLPESVIGRAEQVLETLEQGEPASALTRLADDLPLFATDPATTRPAPEPSPVEAALAEVRPDDLTPKGALELIYRLRALLAEN